MTAEDRLTRIERHLSETLSGCHGILRSINKPHEGKKMEPLIDRIRAYVAAIPTHECVACGKAQACGMGYCALSTRKDSEADALLREVAALEPVSWQSRAKDYDQTWRQITREGFDSPCSANFERRSLYTLTGATHD